MASQVSQVLMARQVNQVIQVLTAHPVQVVSRGRAESLDIVGTQVNQVSQADQDIQG